MRKRVSRPPRFAAVDNNAVDSIPSILAIGLLTTLIRAKDGDDVTVEGLCKTRTEGREALTKAMRILVEGAFVVKFKIQRDKSEVITLDDGSTEAKRGGSWWTTFTVDSIPFTVGDVAAMLDGIFEAGNVKAVRVEPTRLDPRKDAAEHSRPTRGFPSVGATCGNVQNQGVEAEEQQAGPTDGFPTAGPPTVGRSAAHIRKKTSFTREEDEETGVPSARSAVGVRSTPTSGSSEAEEGSGFAAAAKESSASDQEDGTAGLPGQRKAKGPELSREQMAAVRSVEAILPPLLVALLPHQQFPGTNRPAVLAALESRTVEQLRERIARRWVAYGYEPAIHDKKMANPIGAALELIRSTRYCPDLSCEDGTMVDTRAECRACFERRAARRQARAAGQLEPSSSKGAGSGRMPECIICRAPFPGEVPDSGECAGCQREAERAFAALSARLEPSDPAWEAPEPEDAPAAPEDVQEAAGVDEETARLRDYYARQFGTPEQVEAYCNTAPF